MSETVPYPLLKWGTDKLLSLLLILIFTPVWIFIVFSMLISMALFPADRGSLFYREKRITRGREFDILKFRVLRKDVLLQVQKEGKYSRLYEGDSSKLTWAGRCLLKKWYFDELPQLFNIVKGDMSLVGPRPLVVAEVNELLKQGIMYRDFILAGWTGPVQVEVKGETLQKKSTELDLEYLDRCRNWSSWQLWWYDISVLYQTIQIILSGKGLKF